jgi:futalosine hydrolase
MPAVLIVAATELELCGQDGLVCGVGPVEAAAATARQLGVGDGLIDAVVHVGLAGALGVEMGSLVVGAAALYDDIAAQWPVVERETPDADLVEAALGALPGATLLPVHTSARVGAPRDPASRAPLVEAMEGFGVLRAAKLAGVPAVEVRAVPNELGEDDRSRWAVGAAIESLQRSLPRLVEAARDAVADTTGVR